MKLVGVGHALADAYAFVGEDVPKILGLHPGSFNQVPDYRMRAILQTLSKKTLMAGGSAANTVKLAARLGVETSFVGQCGHDESGHTFEAELLAAGVKVNLLRSDSPTGMCVTFLVPTLDRTVATFRSASGNLPVGLVTEAQVAAADVVVLEGYLLDEPEFLADLLDRCAKAGRSVALDTADGNQVERHMPAFQGYLDTGVVRYLFLQESEAATLTGLDAEGALEFLSQSVEVVVLKRGDRGWLVRDQGKVVPIPTAGTVSVDASGAGDGFEAGFLWARDRGWGPVDACRAGSLVAGAVVQQPGTRIDEIRWNRLEEALIALSQTIRV